MIYDKPLTNRQMLLSQKNYTLYCLFNGASYMCLGETILILFAENLNSHNAVISILGSMLYFGFLLLPLGKVMTAHVGAAKSQANFWVFRNIAALSVATCAPISIFISPQLAQGILLLGAFAFYGFRAAGVVMGRPLLGNISKDPEQLSKLIGKSEGLFYTSGLLALLIISAVLYFFDSVW